MSAAPLALAALAAALSPFLAHSASAAQRGPPLLHLSRPEPRWISSANSPPARIGNSVSISPDDAWLYVTGDDGGLTKLDPRNGDVVGGYSPPDPGAGGEGVEWVTYCESGVEFHMDGEGGESFLVYWAFSLPSQSGMEVVSRVVAIRHDPEVEDVEVLWTTELEGIIEGTPVVGSDGDMVYFTMNTIGPTRAVTPRPTVSPTAAKVETEAPATSAPVTSAPVTSEPTQSPDGAFDFGGALVDGETGDQTGAAEELTPFTLAPVPNSVESAPPPSDNQAPTKSPAKTFAFNLINPSPGGNDPGRKLGGSSKMEQRRLHLRNLQLATETGTGKLVVLSHSRSGAPIYEFDSRSLPNVQRHAFAAAGIARSPRYGNYAGGEGNRQDVVMWASRGGADARGETFLFQLPKDFNPSGGGDVNTDGLEVRVMESVGWTTGTSPTFSSDGLGVYFARSGNRYVGWNEGREFDVISNFGGALPPVDEGGSALRPIVLTDGNDKMIIATADHDKIFALDATGPTATGIYWLVQGLGVQSIPTTPIVSPDGEVVYLGKGSAVHGINATDGARLWGQDGFVQDPSANFAIRAEMSLSSTGEFLYHQGDGMSITALRVAEAIPTPAPTGGPSYGPSIASSGMPSGVPSVAASEPPSTSTVPTESAAPTGSFPPSHNPDYIFPSDSPSLAPSDSSAPSDSPSGPAPDGTVSGPGQPTASPTAIPTSGPVDPSVVLPPSTVPGDAPAPAATSPDETSESSSWLTNTAIIGIAVGGGVGLILMVGAIWYVARRKGGGNDGLDTDWQAQNSPQHGGGGPGGGDDGGAMFQYGEEEDFAGQGGGGGRGPSSSSAAGYGAPMGGAPGSSGTWGASGGQQGEGGPSWGEPGHLKW